MRIIINMLTLLIVMIVTMYGCSYDYEQVNNLQKSQVNKLYESQQKSLDTITVIYSYKNELEKSKSIEKYALESYPNYKIISIKFLGIAHDPDCFYEIKLAKNNEQMMK